MRTFATTLVLSLTVTLFAGATHAAAPELEAALGGTQSSGGWAMHVGTTDGSLEAALAKDGRFTVTGIALDAESAETARKNLNADGLLGQVHIHESVDPKTIPAKRHSVGLLIIDLDATGITEEEMKAKVAPFGHAWFKKSGKWQAWKKPALQGADDWSHYDHGANSNDYSEDQLAGYSRGLQWVGGAYGGDDTYGVRAIDGIVVNVEPPHFARRHVYLTARNAYNGTVLWQKFQKIKPQRVDGKWIRKSHAPDSRYSLFVDDQRVYVLWEFEKYMRAYDLRTGEPLLTYDQGFSTEEYKQAQWFRKRKQNRGEPMRALVADGVIIQAYMHRIYALDANSGKRLWMHEDKSRTFNRPLVQDGVLVVLQGGEQEKYRRTANYISDMELFYTDALVAFDLKTGKQKWRHENQWKKTHPSVRNIASADGVVAALFEIGHNEKYSSRSGKNSHYILALGAQTGQVRLTQDDWTSGFHHQKRVAVGGGRIWGIDIKKATGWKIDEPKNVKKLENKAFRANPLWGCSLPRLTPNGIVWWLAGESFIDGSVSISNVGRNGCDMGSQPTQGLLMLTPNFGCGCYGFIGRLSAHHHWEPTPPFDDERLVRGAGKPAAAGGNWPDDNEWPMYLKDPLRSSWSASDVAAKPTIAWTFNAYDGQLPPMAKVMENTQAKERIGPVTPPTAAEGVVAIGSYDTHEVIVLDQATGKVKWRKPIDGRIDSPPTIYKGAVYFGTRAGWVYALNRDTGKLIWKFFAAPTDELIIANGGSENVQPTLGTVTIVDGLVWTNSGRYVELDHGVAWYALDPATGEVKKTGHLQPGTDGRWSRQTGQNTPWVSDGKHIVLHRAGLNVATGETATPNKDWNVGVSSYGYNHDAESHLLMSNYSTLHRGDVRWDSSRQGRAWHIYGVGGTHMAYNGKGEAVGLSAKSHGGGRSAMGGMRDGISRWRRLPKKLKGKQARLSKWQATADRLWESDLNVKLPTHVDGFLNYGVAVAGDKAIALTSDTRKNHQLEIFSMADGQSLSTVDLPAHPANCAIAVANGRIYITLLDGSVVCLK